ncbi:exocyst complex component 2 isoform X1 [Polypterus senegalus]|uniref:exocyst complex component 2 isoform X1 n=1 Tax=Polypterus senegalus TaxID=55291 RepID=UPI00196278E1|nr:exocyst complex component 2 isoform X1 [Polypterus senegalus]XP_039609363.1 exocyst complex component 2 isoform X1 [Polypterus senegalus]XP_039609364.1 exocyst complex component 2 isoform X1 [Polypterus senegalus]
MSRIRQPPLVTGISPNEGVPWTKVTIRGENLGTGPTDLIGLSICGHNCLLTAEWMSASKIVCRVGPAKNDKGEIIVTTKSGGQGTSTVSFKILKNEKIDLDQPSAVWVEEMDCSTIRMNRKKGISPLSISPSDPLGIKPEKGKVTQKELESLFPNMSGDFTNESFSATWYLIENHSAASFDQLKMAANNLRKQASKKNEGSLSYVKGGLSTFFEAQDALAAIHQKLEVDGTEKVEGSMTRKLENVLNRASVSADTLFQEVLGRKDKADSTRNALNVLQRFKFLFNLPLNIERNIQKGDYDVVINDYEKAKSLFGNTEVHVFKKVYAEVETRIDALRKLLLDKLLQTPSTLVDQKRYIRYLSDLHAPGDPAWQCIVAQHKWILKLMQNCKDTYVTEHKGPGVLLSPMMDLENDIRSSSISRLSQTTSVKRGGSFQSPRDEAFRFKGPQQVMFVENLTDVVISQLPNFWKLWISYVNGSLFSETGEKYGQVEKSKKNARQKQNDFKQMIQEVMHSLVKLIRGALLPFSLSQLEQKQYGGWELKSELSGQWLTYVIHTVRSSYEALAALEIPNDLLQVIQDLILDLRIRCLMVTLQQTTEDVKSLAEKEDWIVDNEGITSMPSKFEQCVFQTLQSLKEPLECKTGEVNIFQQERAQDQVSELCIGIMKVFVNCMEQLSSRPDGDIDTSRVSVDLTSPDLSYGIHEDIGPTLEKRLLIIVSNCQYLEKHTFINLVEHFEKQGFPGSEKISRVSIESIRDLDQRLFETYIELKADPIVGSLEPGIYAGYFDWKDCAPPTGVRNYLKEALVNIIAVHAEVFAVSKELVLRVISRIVEAVAEEMSRLMQCVSSFSKNGALQARLEICALKDAIASYLSSESIHSFKQALEALPQLQSGTDKKLLEELLNKFKSSMHLQLTCFQAPTIYPVKT